MEWNGIEWNGMEWNGMEWNRMEWNGMEWNGIEWTSDDNNIIFIIIITGFPTCLLHFPFPHLTRVTLWISVVLFSRLPPML
jgi:hypothetical protein